MECQKIDPCNKPPTKNVPLPQQFKTVKNDPHYEEGRKEEILLAAKCMTLPQPLTTDDTNEDAVLEKVPTWGGSHALTSTSNLKLKQVGFLPIIPNPITRHDTVYACLRNFNSIAASVKQDVLPIVCDEGVYHLVIDIYMVRPELFKNLFLMLGSFHMARAALRCAGKFLRGSGIVDALIESRLFGSKVVEQVLTGNHYVRSFEGLMIVEQAIERLKWEAFWKEHAYQEYQDGYAILNNLQTNLIRMNKNDCKDAITLVTESECAKKLLDAFYEFSQKCSKQSNMCRYWETFLSMMKTIKNLVQADRDGDFLLHVKAVGDLRSIFFGGDGVHYIRCGSFYYELLKSLPTTHPQLYAQFLQGDFVVKTRKGAFNAVSGDMKLEQTIQRSSKSSHGIIGQTRVLNYITEWQLIYHETIAISSALREVTNSRLGGNNETRIHHQLTKPCIQQSNHRIGVFTTFIRDRGNPFVIEISLLGLRNFVTQIYTQSDVAYKFLNFIDLTKERSNDFYKRVYANRTSYLSDKISQFNLLPVDHIPPSKVKTTKDLKKDERESRRALKVLLNAKTKDGNMNNVLIYDITDYSYLFEGSVMTKVTNKSQLIEEIAPKGESELSVIQPTADMCIIIDFMSFIRGQVISYNTFKTFELLIADIYKRCTDIFPHGLMQFIFDSYTKYSLKGSERDSRNSSGTIQLAKIEGKTHLPQQMDKFWGSSKNKCMLQQYASQQYYQRAKASDEHIVLSAMLVDDETVPCTLIQGRANDIEIPELSLLRFEEADQRMIPHIQWCIRRSTKNVMVVSSDTDVLVLLIHYFKRFQSEGLENMWLRVGKADNRRFIPIHTICENLGPSVTQVLLKAHMGTGCDYISKFGTKHGAMKASPELYLQSFGESYNLTDDEIIKAEQYLVKVLKNSSEHTTLDNLRRSEFKRTNSPFDLPPTSYSVIMGHIPRWYFQVKEQANLLNPDYQPLSPLQYGWKLENDELLPEKHLNILPDGLSKTCSCMTGCNTNRCSCRKSGGRCFDYCKCKDCTNN